MARKSFLFRRDYSAFPDLPMRQLTMDVMEFKIEFVDTAFKRIVSRPYPSWIADPVDSYIPDSAAFIEVVGTTEAIALARSVADGSATLGIFADWIEDDPGERIRRLGDGHASKVYRLNDDLLAHFLIVMRAHRPVKGKRGKIREGCRR